jgi:hypothetical protein
VFVTGVNDLVELGIHIEILGCLKGARRIGSITINIGDTVDFGQSASHGGGAATSRHARQFKRDKLHLAGIGSCRSSLRPRSLCPGRRRIGGGTSVIFPTPNCEGEHGNGHEG